MRSRFFFFICILLLVYAILEGLSLAVYSAMEKTPFSFAKISEDRGAILHMLRPEADSKGKLLPEFSLQPYTGFVRNPAFRRDENQYTTPEGFLSDEDPLAASAKPNVAIVGLTGGSVVEHMYVYSRANLRAALQKLPQFHGKRVIITMLGMFTYHEPQQTLAVSNYLMQGGRLDMLINLDGRNEATYDTVNRERHINPTYPYFWKWYFQLTDDNNASNPWRVSAWKYARYELARASEHADWSVTVNTLWRLLDIYCGKNQVAAELQLRDAQKNPHQSYLLNGAPLEGTAEQWTNFKVGLWQESSLQMLNLAKLHGFTYFHFLQPSQYMEGSKQLSEEEMAHSYSRTTFENDYDIIVNTYPQMQARMAGMRQQGENVFDLTNIYKDVQETIYIDQCCHVNKRGNDIMAQAIADRIATTIASHPSPTL